MITRRTSLFAAGASLLAAAPGWAAEPELHKGLAPLNRLLGRWSGEGDGEPGHSLVERTYEATDGGNFIVCRNASTYAPQPKNPKGERHTDVGWFSYDRAGKAVMLRQFHPSEAFVNTYRAPGNALAGPVLVFEAVALENIPAGFRARETFTFRGPDAFDELFEVAEPGKGFATYSLNRLRRV